MTGLDTNVLLRYFLQDDPAQAKAATRAIGRLTRENPGFITTVVMCELNWSLQRAYKISKLDRLSILEHVLSVAEFDVEHEALCRRALAAARDGAPDFADHLIREISMASGCSLVLTFDKAALKSQGFEEPR